MDDHACFPKRLRSVFWQGNVSCVSATLGGCAAILALFTLGCRTEKLPDGMPPLVKFSVTVTQEGIPLPGAVVQFQNERLAYIIDGITDERGVADLKTEGKYHGIPAGQYKITVVKLIATPSRYGEIAPMTQKERDRWTAQRLSEYRPTHSLVHHRCSRFETTDLSVCVQDAESASLEVGAPVDDIIIPRESASAPTPEQ